METVAVVIPMLNEERSIAKVIDSVPVANLRQSGLKTSVYVIDGKSTDNTREIAVENSATILLEERKGKDRPFRRRLSPSLPTMRLWLTGMIRTQSKWRHR